MCVCVLKHLHILIFDSCIYGSLCQQGDVHKHPENSGLVRVKTARSSKRSKDRRKESENLKHAKQEGNQ